MTDSPIAKRNLSHPQSVGDEYLAAILTVQAEILGALGEIRDRLPARPAKAEPGVPVELRDPATQRVESPALEPTLSTARPVVPPAARTTPARGRRPTKK